MASTPPPLLLAARNDRVVLHIRSGGRGRSTAIAVLTFLVAVLSWPAQARAETTFSIEGFTVSGAHAEQGSSVPINGAAGFLELRQRWKPIDLVIEGIPSVGGSGYLRTPTGYPHPLTNVSIVNAISHVRIGPTNRFWLGGGLIIINQQTSLLQPPLEAASRLAGSRYEGVAYLPAGGANTVELRAAYMPALHGAVSYEIGYLQVPPGYGSEVAEATDVSAEYFFQFHDFALGAGARGIDYNAHFVTPPQLADRNTSVGALIEARFRIAK
ncbi:MAG: hypothetical protein JO347_04585 [Candidatus Eremiobacteraeota bacterium]|nr:hypothetical protein [Candidatus Eremiobacteraeota bacterium]